MKKSFEFRVYLEKVGYDAINYIDQKTNLWILDIMLDDDVSGYDLIKEIRKKDANAPVIFTSTRDQELDKILGLELERDDYITKPYSS